MPVDVVDDLDSPKGGKVHAVSCNLAADVFEDLVRSPLEIHLFRESEVTGNLFSVLAGSYERPAVQERSPFKKGDGIIVFIDHMDWGFIVAISYDAADEALLGLVPVKVFVLFKVIYSLNRSHL